MLDKNNIELRIAAVVHSQQCASDLAAYEIVYELFKNDIIENLNGVMHQFNIYKDKENQESVTRISHVIHYLNDDNYHIAAVILLEAFPWSKTNEGYIFWMNIHSYLVGEE